MAVLVHSLWSHIIITFSIHLSTERKKNKHQKRHRQSSTSKTKKAEKLTNNLNLVSASDVTWDSARAWRWGRSAISLDSDQDVPPVLGAVIRQERGRVVVRANQEDKNGFGSQWLRNRRDQRGSAKRKNFKCLGQSTSARSWLTVQDNLLRENPKRRWQTAEIPRNLVKVNQ